MYDYVKCSLFTLFIESRHPIVCLCGLNHYLCLSFSVGDHLSMAKEAHWWDEQPLEGNLGNFFLQPHYKNECHSSGYMCSSLMSIAPVAGYWSEVHSFVSFVKGSNLKCTVSVWGLPAVFSFGLNMSCNNQLLYCFTLCWCPCKKILWLLLVNTLYLNVTK